LVDLAGIRDVSALANVSIATVSRVLSNKGYVSDSARASVLRAVEELQYVPNVLARGLKTKRSGLVALLLPQIVSTYFVSLARGVEDVANKHGYHLIICNTDESLEKQAAYLDLLLGRAVEGVIVASVNRSPNPLKGLLRQKTPVVLVDRLVDNFPADIVRGDSFAGMKVLTKHMLGLGHRRIALINGHLDTSPAADRLAGFRAAHDEAGVPVDETIITSGKWLIDDAETRLNRLLDRGQSFTAVIGANSFMSIGILRSLRSHGLSVPDQIAVAGFDEVELASEFDPFLTTMTQPVHTMGTFAMNMLLERIEGTYSGPDREVVLAPWLVSRRSSGASIVGR
jgi:LacI family transcriptional regulator